MGCCDYCVSSEDSKQPIHYDPDFEGPIPNHKRSCTDIVFLIGFIVFLGLWGFVGYYGHANGDIQKIIAPIDSEGHRCGLDPSVKDTPYLVFFDITQCLKPKIFGCPTRQVCVESCPTETQMFTKYMTEIEFTEKRKNIVCTKEVNVTTMTYTDAISHISAGICADFVIKSEPVMGRCFPYINDAIRTIPEKFRQLNMNETDVVSAVSDVVTFDQLSAQVVQDIVQSRWYLLAALVAVVILCFIYILLLRWIVAPLVWVSLLGLIGLLSFALFLCYKNFISYQTNGKGYDNSIFSQKETWLLLMIIVGVSLLILLLMVIFLRKRISIAIALLKEGSKAVIDVKTTIFFPILPWVIQCFVIVYGVLVLLYLLSIGESTFKVVNFKNDTCDCGGLYTEDNVPCDPLNFLTKCHDTSNILMQCQKATCHFDGLDSPKSVVYLHLANALAFFWTMFFISGVSDMILASTFSTWYWTYHKTDLPFFTLTTGMCRTMRYHLGTVAFGTLIMAIVRTIRVIIEFIDKQLKKFDNIIIRCIMCTCKCCFWCLENCLLPFVNKNAYIMCSVHGTNFCRSARDAMSLIMRNIARVVVLDKVMDFIFMLSKLLISIGVGIAVYFLLQWSFVYEVTQGQPLHYNYIPAIILTVATYLICTVFFNVYEMAVDTLFLCFLEDTERNDGSTERPYYMSKDLMKILGKKNKNL